MGPLRGAQGHAVALLLSWTNFLWNQVPRLKVLDRSAAGYCQHPLLKEAKHGPDFDSSFCFRSCTADISKMKSWRAAAAAGFSTAFQHFDALIIKLAKSLRTLFLRPKLAVDGKEPTQQKKTAVIVALWTGISDHCCNGTVCGARTELGQSE